MATEYIIKFEEKTEIKGRTGQEPEEETVYYTTENDMFVPGSLSFKKEDAKKFYLLYVEHKGNLTKVTTLTQTIIQK